MFVQLTRLRYKDVVAVDLKNVKEFSEEEYQLEEGKDPVKCTQIRFYHGGDDENLLVAEDFLTVLRRMNDVCGQ